jgi:hypothetical protein
VAIDKSKPYGIVCGMPGVRYWQDGNYYGPQGNLVTPGLDTPEPAEPLPPEEVDLDSLHWTQLKKLVEAAGGEYTSKPEAIAFLRGDLA